MTPRIEELAEKKMIGKRMIMSISNNKTYELWSSFMPERKKIQNYIGHDLYSLRVYNSLYFDHFSPENEFEKWACIEVTNFEIVPKGMGRCILPAGLYAVFLYKGAASEGAKAFQYIYASWLPDSEYQLDNRPHFEILGEKYKNDDPASEEEIWIPIMPKA